MVSTDLSARDATACATHASPLAEPFQLQLSGLEASSTASGGALGCLPARLLIPRPPRPRPQFICSSFGEGRVFPEFVAGLPACRSDRPHGQPASISQHQPASSLLVNFDRGIGSLLHLESQPAGHWPWDMGHGHRPSPHRPSCQTAAGPPERLTTNVRATEAVSWRRKDGRRRAQGHKAQGHNTNRSIVGRPAPLWSWTRYCLMNREGCCSAVVPSQTSKAWCRHRIIESSNH